jgi:hypothetical protein
MFNPALNLRVEKTVRKHHHGVRTDMGRRFRLGTRRGPSFRRVT